MFLSIPNVTRLFLNMEKKTHLENELRFFFLPYEMLKDPSESLEN